MRQLRSLVFTNTLYHRCSYRHSSIVSTRGVSTISYLSGISATIFITSRRSIANSVLTPRPRFLIGSCTPCSSYSTYFYTLFSTKGRSERVFSSTSSCVGTPIDVMGNRSNRKHSQESTAVMASERSMAKTTSSERNALEDSIIFADEIFRRCMSTGEWIGPTIEEIFRLRKSLNKCTLDDIGYTYESLCAAIMPECEWKEIGLQSTPPHVVPIYTTPTFHVVAFILPEGCMLDFHDHIGMTVIAKYLLGSAEVDAFNLLGLVKEIDRKKCSQKVASDSDPLQVDGGSISDVMRKTSDEVTSAERLHPTLGSIRIEQQCNEVIATSLLAYGTVVDINAAQLISNAICPTTPNISNNRGVVTLGNEMRSDSGEGGIGFDLCEPKPNSPGNDCARHHPGTQFYAHKVFDGMLTACDEATLDDRGSVRIPSSSSTSTPSLDKIYREISRILYSDSTAIVLSSFGNVHRITSKSKLTVILDILSPPYGVPSERECRYFRQTGQAVLGSTHYTGSDLESIKNGSALYCFEEMEGGGPEYFHELPFLGRKLL